MYHRIIYLLIVAVILGCSDSGSQSPKEVDLVTDKSDSAVVGNTGQREDGDRRLAWQKPDLVIGKLGDLNDKVVADIGAGTGYFTFRPVNRAKKVIAVDIDTNSIRWIESFRQSMDSTLQTKVETRLVLPDDPRLSPNEVDVVIIINTIGYIKDRLTYLRNLKKSIVPGGLLMVVDFKIKRIQGNIAPPPERRVSILDLENDLESAGYFLLETDDTSLDYQYIVLART